MLALVTWLRQMQCALYSEVLLEVLNGNTELDRDHLLDHLIKLRTEIMEVLRRNSAIRNFRSSVYHMNKMFSQRIAERPARL